MLLKIQNHNLYVLEYPQRASVANSLLGVFMSLYRDRNPKDKDEYKILGTAGGYRDAYTIDNETFEIIKSQITIPNNHKKLLILQKI